MIVLSSFTHKMFKRAVRLCNSLKDNLGGAKAVMYCEDAVGDPFPKEVIVKFPWIKWAHFGRADKIGIGKVDVYPEFEKAKGDRDREARYYNHHARFWFRKIAAIRACMRSNPDETLILWFDCDCQAYKPLLEGCSIAAKKGDIGYLKRVGMPTDTGMILFNAGNPMVRSFVEEWYDLYISRRVFSELKYWADHHVFDHVMAMPKFSSLKCYELQKCETIRGIARHMSGHVAMASLRERA